MYSTSERWLVSESIKTNHWIDLNLPYQTYRTVAGEMESLQCRPSLDNPSASWSNELAGTITSPLTRGSNTTILIAGSSRFASRQTTISRKGMTYFTLGSDKTTHWIRIAFNPPAYK